MKPEPIDLTKLDDIIQGHVTKGNTLIPLLQDIQEAFGFIPPACMEPVAEALKLFPAQVQGVSTFMRVFPCIPKENT